MPLLLYCRAGQHRSYVPVLPALFHQSLQGCYFLGWQKQGSSEKTLEHQGNLPLFIIL